MPGDERPDAAAEGPQETFISHLIELRTRLLRSIVAVVIVLLCLFPWAKDIYALLAAPLLRVLPQGATMIATDVTGTFFVPLKVTLMAAFLLALPYVLWQVWAFVAPGLYQHEKRLALPVIVSSFVFFLIGMAFAYFLVFPIAFGFFARYAPAGVHDDDRHRQVPVVRADDVHRVRRHVRGAGRRDRAGAHCASSTLEKLRVDPPVRDRRRVRRRRDLHAARRRVAAAARGAAVAAATSSGC